MFDLPFTTERTLHINKPMDEIFNLVSDFNTWRSWSPWLCQEPECPVQITAAANTIGHAQAWNGERIGQGEMRLTATAPDHLEYDLHFLKPWKSHSRVTFKFTPQDDGVTVVWSMRGTVPIFLFFLRNMMSAWIGSDYTRGLAMLKEYAETGKVLSRVEVKGEVERDSFHYLGRHRKCAIADIGPGMQTDFESLADLEKQNKLPAPDFFLSFAHQFNFVKGECEYTAAYGYRNAPEHQASDLEKGMIPQHQAQQVDHFGAYHHLGNAWSTLIGYQKHNKKKPSKRIPKYEVYVTLPDSDTEENLHTQLYAPFR